MSGYKVERDAKGYEIILGEGEFGVVKLVRQSVNGQLFACKGLRFSKELSHSRAMTKAEVERECEILKRLQHPNITEYVNTEWPEGKLKVKLYMEYCDGGDLQKLIDESKGNRKLFSKSFIEGTVAALSDAVRYCHFGPDPGTALSRDSIQWEPVLHRDIKPQNVFLKLNPATRKLNLKLGDFGLGTVIKVGKAATTYVGTRPYLAPEISRDRTISSQWTEKCDIFSLGCTLYATCMLKPPFEWRAENDSELFTPIRDVYNLRTRISITSCLRFDPKKRPDATSLAVQTWNPFPEVDNEDQYHDVNSSESGPSFYTVDQALEEMEKRVKSEWEIFTESYINLQPQTMLENMEMEKASTFWNPLESMSKKDATS